MRGIDYSWGRPDLNAAALDGVGFICRYISPYRSKNLDATERDTAFSHGLAIVLVWESSASRALSGYAAGWDDGVEADRQTRTLGMGGIPIYFAVDWDAAEAEQGAIDEYFKGVAAAVGLEHTGVYGGYWPTRRLLDAGLVTYAWQTYAWSGGNKDPRIHIYQHQNGVDAYGGNVDLNESYGDDFGQWPRPRKGGDMSIHQPDPVPVGDGRKWIVPWYDSRYPGVKEMNIMLSYPTAKNPGEPNEGIARATVWTTGTENKVVTAVDIPPGQTATYSLDYTGPMEVDFDRPGGYVGLSYVYRP